MTEITDLSTADSSNTSVSGESLDGAIANMGRMDNTLQAVMGLLARSIRTNVLRFLDNADPTKRVALDLTGLTTATTRTYVAPNKNGTLALTSDIGASTSPSNLTLVASVAGNALTIAIKGFDGNDPSSSNPVSIPFRSVTASSGDVDVLTLTAATSLVISSGSTMGFTNATAGRLWIIGFNDGGTFRLGAVNVLSGTSIMALRDGIYSSTAEGGAGAADSAQVIYTGTAVTSKPLTVLGYMEWSAGLTTAGTWAIVPTLVQVLASGVALPGESLGLVESRTGAAATGTGLIPSDNTIPQITEGDQYFSLAVTPQSSANILTISHNGIYTDTGIVSVSAALFQDSTANALAATGPVLISAANNAVTMQLLHRMKAGTSVSTTFRIRAGGNVGGALSINSYNTTQVFNGVASSFLSVEEIMA